MSRFDTAYLLVSDPTDTGVFELHIGLQTTSQMERNYLMGPRGQYVTEVFNAFGILPDIDGPATRRSAFTIDGGAGEWTTTVNFSTGLEDVTWGDGSGGTGPSNVTPRDASGADVKPLSRMNVLELWLTQARTDSENPAFFYFGEWTDGNPSGHTEAGAFNQPLVCAVDRFNVELADPNNDPPSQLSGQIEVKAITPFAAIGVPTELSGSNIGDYSQELSDTMEELQNE